MNLWKVLSMDWCWVNWDHWNRVHWHWVNWNRVDGDVMDGSGVNNWLDLRKVGNTVVLDVGHITARAIGISSVGDNLGATIREGNPVVASHHLGI